MDECVDGTLNWRALSKEAYEWKLSGLFAALVSLVAILAYAILIREPYTGTAPISIGYVAAQWSPTAPVTLLPIEAADATERYLRHEILPKLGLQQACIAQAQAVGSLVIVSCKGRTKADVERCLTKAVDEVLVRHHRLFDIMIQPLRQRIDKERERLAWMTNSRIENGKKTMQPASRGTLSEHSADELTAGILELRGSLEVIEQVRKLDTASMLGPPGVEVKKRETTPLMMGAALVVSLAFGLFVSTAMAVASMMRRGVYGERVG